MSTHIFIHWYALQAVAVATVNATYRWVESEARRVLREVLNAREKERRQEVTPPVARTRQTRSEVSDDDKGDEDDDANRVGAGAAEAQMGPRHDVSLQAALGP